MKMFKRVLCMVLVIIMLPISAFAEYVNPGGTNPAPSGGSSTYHSDFTSLTAPATSNGAGLYIHVQATDKRVVFDPSDPEKAKNTFGEVVEYFTNHLPDTDVSKGITGVYVLPLWTNSGITHYAVQQQNGAKPNTRTEIAEPIWMNGSANPDIKNWISDAAYNVAASRVNEHNPNLSLPAGYWQTVIATGINKEQARNILCNIFAGVSSEVGIGSLADVTRINKAVNRYMGLSAGQNDWHDIGDKGRRNTAIFLNYCGFLATVIATLPNAERNSLAKQLDVMCQDWFSGTGFSPLLVTGEIVFPTAFLPKGDSAYRNWWTPRQALYAITTVNPMNPMQVRSGMSAIESFMAGKTSNPGNGGTVMYGVPTATGYAPYAWSGSNGTGSYAQHAVVIQSVAQEILSEFNITTKPMEGIGIWGLSQEALLTKPPVSTASMTAMGSIGLLVEEKKYEEKKGSYTEIFKTTITVNLGANYDIDSTDPSKVADGAGFANVLGWLAQMRDEGHSFPNPSITVYLKQADAIPAITGDAASSLIERTYGYFGDGNTVTPNAKGEQISSNAIEASMGSSFTWKDPLGGNLIFKDSGIQGVTMSPVTSGIKIEFTDLWEAYNYFATHNDTLTFVGEFTGTGNLENDTSKNQHWFKVGGNVSLSGPVSLEDVNSVALVSVGLHTTPKYDYSTVTAFPEDKPYYYSRYQQPYSELKQGTVPSTGGGSSEKFNSMTGTPTFTDTSVRTDFDGTIYENAGHYYQYFASGGSEFVVQFDGEYMTNQTATRTFTFNFSTANCDKNTIPHVPAGAHVVDAKTGAVCTGEHDCPHGIHYTCNPHSVTTNTVSFNVVYTGLSYIKITNLKVWKLSEARLDGTRELLDTDEVKATVQSVAPSVSYNIAATNTAKAGRMVYDYLPTGTNGDPDNLVWNFSTPASCSGVFEQVNLQAVKNIISNSAAATCVSDFIVLRTSNGDQSIVYNEYRAGEGVKIADNAVTTTTSPTTGTSRAVITVSGGAKDNQVAFQSLTYAQLWSSNSKTSKGSAMPEDGVTYGGYSGNYQKMDTKYQSSGHSSNIDFNSTIAYKNPSGVFHPTQKPTQKLRLLNDRLVIPDSKQNGEYIVGNSEVFYLNIINYNTAVLPNYPIVRQAKFDNQYGFVVKSTYSPTHDKINDVVVYNPVSNQYAMIVSLPAERDQRVKKSATGPIEKTQPCPGDASCPYLINVCTRTDHIHTEECYQQISYEVNLGYTTHVHTAACPYHMEGGTIGGMTGYVWYNSVHDVYLSYGSATGHEWDYCSNHSSYYVGYAQPAYKVYDCGNLPLNAYTGGSSGGSMSEGETKLLSYTGNVQSITLGPGTYKLEVWGAQGGKSEHGIAGGQGGYSTGTITLTEQQTVYVYVGGAGSFGFQGGWNGGGNGSNTNSDSAGGGGATDLRVGGTALNNRVIVAGGGGGSGCSSSYGGAGGGTTGGAAVDPNTSYGGPGGPGTQTSGGAGGANSGAGSLGQGGSTGTSYAWPGAGGGGGYYGGGAGGNTSGGGGAGGGGSGYIGGLSGGSMQTGVRTGNGQAKITCVEVAPSSYTVYKSLLACDDPHHAYSYNWKIYTYGLIHESGHICTGRGCSDTTPLIFPTQEHYTVTQCAAGYIVRHANGDVHLSTTQGTCSYCGATYKELLSPAQSSDRVPDASEYSHYTYGDARCWAPCGNPANHQHYATEVTSGGVTYKMGEFINLDWKFEVCFPNTGDFQGTGARWSSTTSGERGAGYVNGMDATEWTKVKWVEFPFAVLYNNQTYLAYERIYLEVPKTLFEFYVPLQDSEIAQAEIKFGSVAINTQNGETLECGDNRDHNIEIITYRGKPKAHNHNADKRTYIDVVGRIGNLTLEDTGDFRFANFFKQTVAGWIVDNIVRKVDFTRPNNLFTDQIDVRGVGIGSTGVGGDTYGSKTERRNLSKLFSFPISPVKNNITALQRQPIRLGYDSYFDLTTLGNYYGAQVVDEQGGVINQQMVFIKPHYYRLDLDSKAYSPVDVYMDVNGNKVLVNDFDSNTVAYNGTDSKVNINWLDESARRNFSGSEVTFTNNVKAAYPWIVTPSGSSWIYGNYNLLNLTQRNRTFVGFEETYGYDKDPSEKLADVGACLQGARWHFNVGLPSSAVFVYSGQTPSQANIDVCAAGNAVVFCALEIYAQGEVWTLAYDGSNVNKPFTVVPGGPTYDPSIFYPADKSPKGEEMPIVSIFSINKSSKQDLNTSGTH